MYKSLVSVFLAALFLSVAVSLSLADEAPLLVADDAVAVSCCAAKCCPVSCDACPRVARFACVMPQRCECVAREVVCVKAVGKRGPLGRCHTVYVPCECCSDSCCDACAGRTKVVRVGYRLVKAKICNCGCDAVAEVDTQ